MSKFEEEIREHIKELDQQLLAMRDKVLWRAASVLDRDEVTICSLHGIIGGKNNEYTNVADNQYADFRVFQAAWAAGLLAKYEALPDQYKTEDNGTTRGIKLFQDSVIREYILLFQERNFYKHYQSRIRQKPDSDVWILWFGAKLIFGLFIAMAQTSEGNYRVDHSEIRKVPYQYWTVGHILTVGGFVNGETGKLYRIHSVDDLLNFYENIVYSSSSSPYEKAIYTRYIDYLKNSADILGEPFLIPELRYGGLDTEHKYRLDFTIFNPYTFEFVGFELSPASTHMSISGMKDKTQTQVNNELSAKWNKECAKRNEYFSQFGITTITFSDEDLQDMDKCFGQMKIFLCKRTERFVSLQESIKEINNIEV